MHGNDVWRFQAFDCFWKMKIIRAKISLNLASSQINVKEQITPKMEKNWLLPGKFHFKLLNILYEVWCKISWPKILSVDFPFCGKLCHITPFQLVNMTKWLRLPSSQKLQMALNQTLISFPVKTVRFRFTYVWLCQLYCLTWNRKLFLCNFQTTSDINAANLSLLVTKNKRILPKIKLKIQVQEFSANYSSFIEFQGRLILTRNSDH